MWWICNAGLSWAPFFFWRRVRKKKWWYSLLFTVSLKKNQRQFFQNSWPQCSKIIGLVLKVCEVHHHAGETRVWAWPLIPSWIQNRWPLLCSALLCFSGFGLTAPGQTSDASVIGPSSGEKNRDTSNNKYNTTTSAWLLLKLCTECGQSTVVPAQFKMEPWWHFIRMRFELCFQGVYEWHCWSEPYKWESNSWQWHSDHVFTFSLFQTIYPWSSYSFSFSKNTS